MKTKMTLLLLLTIILGVYTTFSQITKNVQPDSIIVNLKNNIIAFGPKGFCSYGLAPKSKINQDELNLYPKTKNIPKDISEVVEYCFIIDYFQFFYQNYKAGLLSNNTSLSFKRQFCRNL